MLRFVYGDAPWISRERRALITLASHSAGPSSPASRHRRCVDVANPARSGRGSGCEIGIRLRHPLALFGSPLLVGATQLPIAGG